MADAIDFEAVKNVQRHVWSEGDFAMIATTINIVAESLCETVDVLPGDTVLDVACGSGNTAIAAARRFAEVTGVDYVEALLERARERAHAERLDIAFAAGDAEDLQFPDASFDVVLSTFGAMFAPNQPRAAAELMRVCRPGGRIGMSNWSPEGVTGQMFRLGAKYAAPPAAIDPPVLWGTEERVRELFGDGVSSIRFERRLCQFRFHSAEHWLNYFRRWFGPTKAAFDRLDEAGASAYEADLIDLMERNNRAGDRALVVPSEYIEVVAVRAG
jgi:SAM-dependent methyltransferase